MARKMQDKKLESIYNKVNEYPGKKPGFTPTNRILRMNR
jgi:hypothetical protein